jgi:anti-anti-sigma regulatory factor
VEVTKERVGRLGDVTSGGSAGEGYELVVALDGSAVAGGLTELRARLGEAMISPDARLVVDVSRLDVLSSPVVAALLRAKRTCLARGVPMRVTGAGGRGRAQLSRTGLGDALAVVPRQGGRAS